MCTSEFRFYQVSVLSALCAVEVSAFGQAVVNLAYVCGNQIEIAKRHTITPKDGFGDCRITCDVYRCSADPKACVPTCVGKS